MRLTDCQIQAIRATFEAHFLPQDEIRLFGSRVDDSKKGGDIDLYITTHYDDDALVFKKQIAFSRDLKNKIGDQKIDIVINMLKKNRVFPIYQEAMQTGVLL